MKIVVIGSGGFARKHAHLFSALEGVTVSAFASRTAEHAAAAATELAEQTGHPVASYAHVPAALDREQPDAAIVAVTPNAHGAIERALIARRIPFLVEKPIGMDAETPRDIAASIEETGLVTSVGFHMRYLDTVGALAARLAGEIPVIANGYWMGTLPPPPWWRHAAESGGQLVEQAVHIIDLIRYLFGEVASVYATTTRRAIHKIYNDADVPDAGAAILHMQSGLTATLVNTCLGKTTLRVGLETVTDTAWHRFEPKRLRSLTGSQQGETREEEPQLDPYELQARTFLSALRSGDDAGIRSSYRDALRTHEVMTALSASASTGRPQAPA